VGRRASWVRPGAAGTFLVRAWAGRAASSGAAWFPVARRLADGLARTISVPSRTRSYRLRHAEQSNYSRPATGAAHRLASRVAKVIYFSAVVPEQGKSMADENEQYGEIIRQAIAASPDATIPVGLDAVQGVLMPGDPAPLQELVSQLLLPQPGGYMTGSFDLPPVTKIGLDTAYVLCADDIALARPGAEFAARLGVDPLVIPGNHMTMLTHPAVVADALVSLL
jgi:hypothetical protein